MNDKFVIPNENTDSSGSTKIMKYHLKSNYIATINPTKLRYLTFNITNENGESVENKVGSEISSVLSIVSLIGSTLKIKNTGSDNIGIPSTDALYTQSGIFIGFTTKAETIDGNTETDITIYSPTSHVLYGEEKIMYASPRTALKIQAGVVSGNSILVHHQTF